MNDDQQQSCMTECVYCAKVRPEIGADCPRCGGHRHYAQPAQMMAAEYAREHVLQELFRVGSGFETLMSASDEEQSRAAQELHSGLISTLQSMSIYGFDLETAVIELIQSVERDFDLKAALR